MGQTGLKFLIDTNIFIPLEPTGDDDVVPGTVPAAEFLRQIQEIRCQVFVHEATLVDVERDKDEARKRRRRMLFEKYPQLPDPPPLAQVEGALGFVPQDDHDWVDHHLLAAVVADAVHWLVTEDRGIHTKARRLGIGDRVVRLADAIAILEGLFGRLPPPPPAVETLMAYALNPRDDIFSSLRADYPNFDPWFTKARLAHRQSWVVRTADAYDALAIVKEEDDSPYGLRDRVLKICTFKVSQGREGFRYGELLLKTIFGFSVENRHDWLYVTVLPKHEQLLAFLSEFGFEELAETTSLGEKVLAKPMRGDEPSSRDRSPIEFHRRYGPRRVRFDGVPALAIPIQPRYHAVLFPDAESQVDFTAGRFPAGNGIRKAYLCHASIREIPAGSLLLFYLSGGAKRITVLGVAEETKLSADTDEIARFVARRTVYPYSSIVQMCEKSPVRAILFRQARILASSLKLGDLMAAGLLNAPPQSITQLPSEAGAWLKKKLGE